ncbi:MAG: hypothetical protein JWN08_1967, partial [Frankiales bacterium]|nr:hypothetical protein [Frankiales bacterium]
GRPPRSERRPARPHPSGWAPGEPVATRPGTRVRRVSGRPARGPPGAHHRERAARESRRPVQDPASAPPAGSGGRTSGTPRSGGRTAGGRPSAGRPSAGRTSYARLERRRPERGRATGRLATERPPKGRSGRRPAPTARRSAPERQQTGSRSAPGRAWATSTASTTRGPSTVRPAPRPGSRRTHRPRGPTGSPPPRWRAGPVTALQQGPTPSSACGACWDRATAGASREDVSRPYQQEAGVPAGDDRRRGGAGRRCPPDVHAHASVRATAQEAQEAMSPSPVTPPLTCANGCRADRI